MCVTSRAPAMQARLIRAFDIQVITQCIPMYFTTSD